jgi:hypothetical protein
VGPEAGEDEQRPQPVADAFAERDTRRLEEITRRDRDLIDPRTSGGGLREYLLVKDKRIGVTQKRHRAKEISAERPKAGVILTVVTPEASVFYSREEFVANPFPARHPANDCPVVQQPRPDHHVGISLSDRLHHCRDQSRVVLIIGMDHDHDVGAIAQGVDVTRLLIGPVAPVRGMDDHVEPLLECDGRGLVRAGVIDHDRLVDGCGW